MLLEKFRNGMNLGGWLSQYDCLPNPPKTRRELEEHFNTFLTKKDLERISSWGFDHVRLPISDYLLYDMERKSLAQLPMELIGQCISWCEEFHLNMVLDLHDLWGNVYGAMDTPMGIYRRLANICGSIQRFRPNMR